MIEGIVAPLIEVIVAIAAAVIHVSFWILKASARGWRYLLSASYRTQVHEQLRDHSALQRHWFALTSACAVLGSIAVAALLIWLVVIA